MKKLNALLIGSALEILSALPALLSRAGFNVDVITNATLLRKSRFISSFELVLDSKLIPIQAAKRNLDNYDFIIACDDSTLKNILEADIAIKDKLKLLPVNGEKDLKHIYSKIRLSKILLEANINTPDFVVVNSFGEAVNAAQKLGYEVLVKVDSSGGGDGVFECKKQSDFNLIDPKIFDSPLLIQKKINGVELDLSALYRDGKLVHFSYSEIKKVIANKFGPSVLRTYHQLSTIDQQVFTDLSNLGEALGANGFVNIASIKSSDDNKIYFFEADMRPNVWVDFTKFIGDDAAIKIAKWFLNGQTLQYPQPVNNCYPPTKLMPYCLRMSSLEVLFNRYNVWSFIFKEEDKVILELVFHQLFYRKIKSFLRQIKNSPNTLIKLVLPKKEDRLRVKNYFKQLSLIWYAAIKPLFK
jgi:hypothetical protein